MSLLMAASCATANGDKPSHSRRKPGAKHPDGPSVVKVVATEAGFELQRDGKPYFILGAGGQSHLDQLVAAGGNSIRTWHQRNLRQTLDQAHKMGLSVCAGIWLQHESQGFDYSNVEAVSQTMKHALQAVEANKDHPALLIWAVGNEMEGRGDKPAIWRAVNEIAKAIKATDPNHPTMTVIADTGRNKIRQINKYCPDIDIVGINAYGDLGRIAPALEKQEMSRPYVMTEFGPYGWWQVGKTSWGAELEPISTDKAKTYMENYKVAVLGQPSKCLGSYAFLWGHKQEHTHTWFGMFLDTGQRTASVDAMTKMWSGKWPANRCPVISALTVEPKATQADQQVGEEGNVERIYAPGTELLCQVKTDDPEGDALTVRWELRVESKDKRTGGFREEVPQTITDTITEAGDHAATVKLPGAADAYRIFVTVTDEHNNAATANLPVLVRQE